MGGQQAVLKPSFWAQKAMLNRWRRQPPMGYGGVPGRLRPVLVMFNTPIARLDEETLLGPLDDTTVRAAAERLQD